MQMLFVSAATGVRQRHVAGFSAVGTVVEPVSAQVHIVLPFADGAILLAGTALFRLVAHRANDRTGHGSLHGKLYLTLTTCGKASVPPAQRGIHPLTAPLLSPSFNVSHDFRAARRLF
jgi:hypothetical protein